MITREPIYAALFDRLKVIAKFATASRRLKHWSDVQPPDQPALFVSQGNHSPTVVPGFHTVWNLRADVYVYVNTGGDKNKAPGTILNPLLDAVEQALAIDNIRTNKCTLGGLVEHCWIEGDIETDEGVLGDQGVAIIPIVMRVPSPQ